MKITVLAPYLPHRNVGHGSGIAARDLVTSLARVHEVQVIALIRPGEEKLTGQVADLGVTVVPVPFADKTATGTARVPLYRDRLAALGRSLVSGYPMFVEKYWSPRLARRIAEAVTAFAPDAVHVEALQMALHVRDLRRRRDEGAGKRPRLVLNSIELGSLPRERRALRAGDPITRAVARFEAAAWRRLQVDTTAWADRTLCVTPEDHVLYENMGGRGLITVPIGMDLDHIRADWAPGTAEKYLFVGSYRHRPNRLAVDILLDQVWPVVRKQRPAAQLLLVGRGLDEYLAAKGAAASWNDQGVTALGFVEDLTPVFRDCRLFLAPLPEGGGIKIKILEAMARGIPVITTPIGAEGITGAADDAIVIAACDERFTAAVLDAAASPAAAAARARRARTLMEEKFSWSAIVKKLTGIYAGQDAD